jgi:hypothetical protein
MDRHLDAESVRSRKRWHRLQTAYKGLVRGRQLLRSISASRSANRNCNCQRLVSGDSKHTGHSGPDTPLDEFGYRIEVSQAMPPANPKHDTTLTVGGWA